MDDGPLPRLETARLLLHVPSAADADAMSDYVRRNRDHLAPWDPERDESYFTLEHWRATLADVQARCRAGSMLQLVLRRRDAPAGPIVGQVTLSAIVRGPFQAAYLGYALDRGAVGGGLMTEALEAVIGHAFGAMNLHRLMANYMPENERSARVLERLGFVREGFAHDYLHLAGDWRDHVLTALVNDRWRPVPGSGDVSARPEAPQPRRRERPVRG